jgi:hypothetical protein
MPPASQKVTGASGIGSVYHAGSERAERKWVI